MHRINSSAPLFIKYEKVILANFQTNASMFYFSLMTEYNDDSSYSKDILNIFKHWVFLNLVSGNNMSVRKGSFKTELWLYSFRNTTYLQLGFNSIYYNTH